MSVRPVLPAPPRITGAADGTLYQIVGEVMTPITRGDGSAAQEGDAVTWDETAGRWVASLAASSGATRGDASITTASLADGATENGVIALGKLSTMHTVTLSRSGWIRLYCTAAARTDDAARTSDLDPRPGAGVIGEVIVDDITGPAILLGPKFIAANNDDPATTDIYYAYTNLSGETGTCDITVSRTVQEI